MLPDLERASPLVLLSPCLPSLLCAASAYAYVAQGTFLRPKKDRSCIKRFNNLELVMWPVVCPICVLLGWLMDLTLWRTALGPDSQKTIRVNCSSPPSAGCSGRCPGLVLECFASELQLRGTATVAQPHIQDEIIFCWNGEESIAPASANDFSLTLQLAGL